MSNSTPSSKPVDGAVAVDVAGLLAEFDASKQSAAGFARERGIAPWKIYYALRRRGGARRAQHLAARAGNRSLVPVRIVDVQQSTRCAPVELVLAGGHRLLIPSEFDETTLRRLVGVLGEVLSFPPSPSVRIFIARKPVDMRKGFDGLSGLVIDVIDEDPQSGHLFVFFNSRRDRMKSLVWDGSGYWLLCKRLEHGRFQIFDRVGTSRDAFELSSSDFALLMDGIDLRGARRRISHDEITRAS